MEIVRFVFEATIREEVKRAYKAQEERLRQLLPYAHIHHVGSTAVPGSLTKGDLDIQIRVAREDFEEAATILSRHYGRVMGSPRIERFAAFKNDSVRPPLDIKLTVAGDIHDVCRYLLRDFFIQYPELTREYNAIKRRCHGMNMEDYRNEKDAFLAEVVLQLMWYGRPRRHSDRSFTA